jgi:hypothetical protein
MKSITTTLQPLCYGFGINYYFSALSWRGFESQWCIITAISNHAFEGDNAKVMTQRCLCTQYEYISYIINIHTNCTGKDVIMLCHSAMPTKSI